VFDGERVSIGYANVVRSDENYLNCHKLLESTVLEVVFYQEDSSVSSVLSS